MLTFKDKDNVRLFIDDIIKYFDPRPTPDEVKTMFIPVVDEDHNYVPGK